MGQLGKTNLLTTRIPGTEVLLLWSYWVMSVMSSLLRRAFCLIGIVEDTKTKPCLYPGLVDCSHSKHIVVILVVTMASWGKSQLQVFALRFRDLKLKKLPMVWKVHLGVVTCYNLGFSPPGCQFAWISWIFSRFRGSNRLICHEPASWESGIQ